MPSLKPLKSLAHNIPHHFASTLFYWKNDYAINHLANAAKIKNIDIVEIDLLTCEYSPEFLNNGITGELLAPLKEFTSEQIIKHKFQNIPLMIFKVSYDFSVKRKTLYDLPTYDCLSLIQTACGRKYEVKLTESNN